MQEGTGGEYGVKLEQSLHMCKQRLPSSAVHSLTSWRDFSKRFTFFFFFFSSLPPSSLSLPATLPFVLSSPFTLTWHLCYLLLGMD